MDLVAILQYVILGVIAVSGLFIGKLLSMAAPEELRPSKKFLIIFQKVIFVISLTAFSFTIEPKMMKIFAIFILAYFLLKIRTQSMHTNNNYYLLYTALGLFLGLTSMQYIIYPTFLVFLIGLPTTALNHDKTPDVFVKLFIVFMVFYMGAFWIHNF
ncbi:hypothetical protein H6503_03275 [Candidatus Woesearchaeota archaeon]|nr:hypothetical protein [Candidatus Woesearchaeota archaeon]